MSDYYTENLAAFGYREIALLSDILNAWIKLGLPSDFYPEQVKPAFNKLSGYIFLTNGAGEVAMLNNGRLELYHNLPYSGKEGFLDDLIHENNPDDLHIDDIEYLLVVAMARHIDLPESWINVKITNINDGE